MSESKPVAVVYVGVHPEVEVPVGDVSLWFERDVPQDVDSSTAAVLVAGGLFQLAGKPSASIKEK